MENTLFDKIPMPPELRSWRKIARGQMLFGVSAKNPLRATVKNGPKLRQDTNILNV